MTLTSELYCLTVAATATVLMWIPYTVARILTRGLMPALANPDPLQPPDPPWAERARRAHANAVENMAVFAPLVLAASFAGVSTSATVLAAKAYLGARLVHYVVYTAGIPVIRTLAFLAGFCANLVFAIVLLSHAVTP